MPTIHPPSTPNPLQWSSKAYDNREACTRIYNAARVVLSAIFNVRLADG